MNETPSLRFGKYRGVPMDEVPSEYLDWVLENVNLRPFVRSQINAALSGQPWPTPPPMPPGRCEWHWREDVLRRLDEIVKPHGADSV